MTLPWYDETDLPDWDPPDDVDSWLGEEWPDEPAPRPVVTVELPPMPGEET